MALKLGELSAVITADDKPFNEGLDKAKKRFGGFSDKLKVAGAAAGAAVGAALAAGVVGALKLDAARTKLANQLGDEELAAELGAAAGDAYGRGFGDSAAEAMTAVRSTMQGGLLPPDADQETIEGLTTRALALADTFGLDVSQAVRAAGQMIRTGMAGDGAEALDLLTRGFQETGDLSGDLLDTVTEYGTKFRDLGLDGQQAMGLISQGMQAGARDTDKVADAVKEFSIRAIDGSEQTAEGFQRIGLDAKRMADQIAAGGPEAAGAMDQVLDKLRQVEDPVARDAAAVALFGTQAEDLGDALFALDPSQAVDSLGEVKGAAGDMADRLEKDATQQLESFKRSAKQALVQQLARAIPYLQSAGEWAARNKAVLGPLAGILGGLAAVIGTIIGIYKVWTAAQIALNIAMSLNPIGLIVLAIAGLIAVIVLIATKTTWFQDIWSAAWGWIKDAAAATGSFFKDTVWGDWILGSFESIGDWIGKVVGWFQDIPGRLKSGLAKVAGFVSAPFRAGFNKVAGLWNGTVGKLSWTVPSWVPRIGGNTLSAPKLPRLAQGGILPAVPGGHLVVAGEGGDDEAIAPLGKLAGMIRDAVRTAGGRQVITLILRGDGLLSGLRDEVAVQGGDVQAVLGG